MNKKGGLQKLKRDKKDWKIGAFFQLPKLSELPANFSLLDETPLNVEHQKNSDFCTAMATGYMTEFQEGVDIEPSWSFAVSKMLSDDYGEWGQDLRTAMKTHVKFGALEKKDSPFSLENRAPEFLRRIENWPSECFDKAKIHQKEAYFSVVGPCDSFDDCRASLWAFRAEKRAIAIGLLFGWQLSDIVLKGVPQGGFGHALTVTGWRTIEGVPYLEVLNSYGEEAGDKGKHHVSRETVNKFVKDYGGFMFADKPDLPKEELVLKSQQYKVNLLVKLYYALKELIFQFGKVWDGEKV